MKRERRQKTKEMLFLKLVNEPDLDILAGEFDDACNDPLIYSPEEQRVVLAELRGELGPILRAIAKDKTTARDLAFWIQDTRSSKIDVNADSLTLSAELGDPPTEGSATEFAYINLIIEELWKTFRTRRIDLLKKCTVCPDLYLLGRYEKDPKYCSKKCANKSDHLRHRPERLKRHRQYQKMGATSYVRCKNCRKIFDLPERESSHSLPGYLICPACGEHKDIRDIIDPGDGEDS